eukprot:610638-Rhodomonas_salina.1
MPAPHARARARAPARAPASFSGGACQSVWKAHTFCFIGQTSIMCQQIPKQEFVVLIADTNKVQLRLGSVAVHPISAYTHASRQESEKSQEGKRAQEVVWA